MSYSFFLFTGHMIKSKFTIWTWPFVFVLTILPIKMLNTVYNIVINNLSNLTDLTTVVQIIILTFTIFFLLLMLERHTRGYVIHNDTLEIKYLLGLSKEVLTIRT